MIVDLSILKVFAIRKEKNIEGKLVNILVSSWRPCVH